MENTIGIDFDWKEQRIYWSDVQADIISRGFVNGTGREKVITTGLITAEGLEVLYAFQAFCYCLVTQAMLFFSL